MFKSLFIIGLLFSTFQGFSQDESVEYLNFSASPSNGKVLLNWSIQAGSTCNGTDILRSTDNENFEIIGDIVGLCGDPSFKSDYTFTDDSPVVNKTNYYKLRFPPSGYTHVVSVEVLDLSSTNYIIKSNPIQQPTKLYFRDNIGDEAILYLIDAQGKQSRLLTTNQNYFLIDPISIENGIYYFIIAADNREAVRGKFVVLK